MASKRRPPAKQAVSGLKRTAGGRFPPGQSGNPKGRPPVGKSLAEVVRRIGEEPLTVGGQQWTRLEAVIRRLYQDAIAGKERSAELLFDRGFGRAVQPIADWREEAEKAGLRPGDVFEEMVQQLARKLPQEGSLE